MISMNRKSRCLGWLARTWLMFCLIIASTLGIAWNLPGAAAPAPANATASPPPEHVATPISEVKLGQRVAGVNPIREQIEEIEPHPATWRKISLSMLDSSGKGVWVELLRPLAWVEAGGIQRCDVIGLDMPEVGAVGEAIVIDIAPCPSIQAGAGTVVTGTFRHEPDAKSQVLLLKIEGRGPPLTVTANHTFWSEDRQQFIEAGKLRTGEVVNSLDGLRKIQSSVAIAFQEPVYNLETTEHVYRVGDAGVLVHNACHSRLLGNDLIAHGYTRPGKSYQAAHIVPTGAFSNRNKAVTDALKDVQKKFDRYLGGSSRDKSINGFWAEAGHAGTHTDNYFLALGKEFEKVGDVGSAKRAMNRIWKRIQKGEFQ